MHKQAFLITDLTNYQLTALEKDYLNHPKLYGIILFTKNYQDSSQIKSLIKQIKQINPNLKIGVDYEGGRVQRFKEGFSPIESMRNLGKLYDHNPNQAIKRAAQIGQIMAKELKGIAIDINFAPVVDIDYGYQSGAIIDRAIHHNPQIIEKLALEIIQSMQASNLDVCLKHFPTHGFVLQDSHFELAKDSRKFKQLKKNITIYDKLITNPTIKINYLMLSHIIYPDFDNLPVFLSQKWIDFIRKKLNYQKFIISDDLNMQAAQCFGNIEDLINQSLKVGIDLIILTHNESTKLKVLS